jgi:hypothetical protein
MNDLDAFESARVYVGDGVGGNTAGKLSPIQVANAHDITGVKESLASGDTRWEKASSVLSKSFLCAIIDDDGSPGMMKESDPTFPAAQTASLREKQGPFIASIEDTGHGLSFFARSDDERDAGSHHHFRSFDFGNHTSDGGRAAGAPSHLLDGGVDFLKPGNDLRPRLSEVFYHTVHSGENDQEIGWQQACDEGGEFVVIAELEFGERGGVILVYYGHNTVTQQGDQGVSGVEVALVVLEVGVSQQDLSNSESMRAEELLVSGHKAGLADGGASLEFGEIRRPLRIAQNTHAGSHRTG